MITCFGQRSLIFTRAVCNFSFFCFLDTDRKASYWLAFYFEWCADKINVILFLFMAMSL